MTDPTQNPFISPSTKPMVVKFVISSVLAAMASVALALNAYLMQVTREWRTWVALCLVVAVVQIGDTVAGILFARSVSKTQDPEKIKNIPMVLTMFALSMWILTLVMAYLSGAMM